jgi:transglutaminase-like putative cysteine protease
MNGAKLQALSSCGPFLFARDMKATFLTIPSGDGGTYATLAHMRRLARRGATHSLVRQTAASIVRGVSGTNGLDQAQAIREWIGDNVAFLRDPLGIEALYTPDLMIRTILTKGVTQVDCDDVATLAASLGLAIGLLARFIVVGFHSPKAPFQHVWTDLSDPRHVQWIDVDTTRPFQDVFSAIKRVQAFEV